ncbi:MAG TPA: cobalamin biosynthesis protein [Jatrophihabitans sp.]|nr:cobalamin biosynthesis protein [Jatrophihabitans sp.]
MSRRARLAIGLLAGVALDAVVPDPRVGHPVAGFGSIATAVERRVYADSRVRGSAFALGCVIATAAGGVAIERRAGRYPGIAAVAAGTWMVLGARSLRREAGAVHELLTRGDLDGARARVTHLVGRDPSALDADGVARAAVESVAENTCDAVVAPLLWGAIGGLPGLLGYRAVNTLDAMVGHRSARYANFGWAAARLDDVANVVPARVTALLVALAAPAVGGDGRAALKTALRDGRRHPSPNSGFSEAAYAGALGLQLGGRNVYAGRTEHRPQLGAGPAPTAADLPRAARLCAAVTSSAAVFAAALAVARPRAARSRALR